MNIKTETTKDLLRKYDEICAAAYVNLFTLFKYSDDIVFRNFDPKNEEHLFVLGVAKGLAGATNRKVYLDISRFQLWKLNRGIDKDCRMFRAKHYNCNSIDPDFLLKFMRDKAVEACGSDFTFADIYKEFYERKKK